MNTISSEDFTEVTNLIAHAVYWDQDPDAAIEAYNAVNDLGFDDTTADLLVEAADYHRTGSKQDFLDAARKILAEATPIEDQMETRWSDTDRREVTRLLSLLALIPAYFALQVVRALVGWF